MTAASSRPWRTSAEGVIVRVRLTPKSSREEIGGLAATPDGPAFLARVRAVPEDGAANVAVERLLAGRLGVPKSAVRLVHGGKARVKSLEVSGDRALLEGRLVELLEEGR